MWDWRWTFRVVLCGQWGQENGFSLVWVLRWAIIFVLSDTSWQQILHRRPRESDFDTRITCWERHRCDPKIRPQSWQRFDTTESTAASCLDLLTSSEDRWCELAVEGEITHIITANRCKGIYLPRYQMTRLYQPTCIAAFIKQCNSLTSCLNVGFTS